jgi:hypothetical protein
MIVPNQIKRRYSEFFEVLYEMLHNTDYGSQAVDFSKNGYINYIVDELLYNTYLPDDDTPLGVFEDSYIPIIKFLFGPKIGIFWEEINNRK